ncbi:MAG TPA: chloride channel protein [Chitinophagaceae bacterium]|nr:chloride channel protein [Chitinophagaceae bacterium]
MNNTTTTLQSFKVNRQRLRLAAAIVVLSVLAGLLVALFLWLLDLVTQFHWQHNWLLYLLPLAGIGIYFLYRLAGKNAGAGNNLVMEEIHQPGGGVPVRMAPLVLLTTLVTHLFGGSAGREGTAVQMGGSIAAGIARKWKLSPADTRLLLMTGIAAGFGAVFGTPVTGAVFAIEVLVVGSLQYRAILPCLFASALAALVCAACGIAHTAYYISSATPAAQWLPIAAPSVILLGKTLLGGIAFGLASYSFSRLQHIINTISNRYIPVPWLIPFIGGLIIILLCFISGTRNYTGLGVTAPLPSDVSIVNAFHTGGASSFSWLWKIIFTAFTLGMGFKGGEVTPLFFIGATMGNALAMATGAPVDLFAGLGFIAVFAGATKTPLACTIMGMELFGSSYVIYFALACFTAFYCSGKTGIYTAQRRKTKALAATTNSNGKG